MKSLFGTRKVRVPNDVALFHVTHWKAGSQWMRAVLGEAFGPDAVVEPLEYSQHLLNEIQPGRVYPCAYITRQEYHALALPKDARRVVLIRDPRDTLVSWYFSTRNTHSLMGRVGKLRWFLQKFDEEQGLLYMMELSLHHCAYIQRSWMESGEPVMRLEDIMSDAAGALGRLFRQHWRLDVAQDVVDELASKHAFSRYSGGRKPGEEDRNAFYRKGVHGDWRHHFTPKVLERFKAQYNDLLIMGGYEKDNSWGL